MRTIKTWLATIAVLLCSISASAYDFEVDGIYYRIPSQWEKKVEVTYKGEAYDAFEEYSGQIVLPENVTYNGVQYSVTGIDSRAFSGCKGLTDITLPNSLKSISTYAFSECI